MTLRRTYSRRVVFLARTAGVGLCLTLLAVSCVSCNVIGPALIIEAPEGFQGGAYIYYEQMECPSLERQRVMVIVPARVITIREDGTACTSDKQPVPTIRFMECYEVASDGSRTTIPIWDEGDDDEVQCRPMTWAANLKRECIFIGSNKFFADRTRNTHPC